MLKVEYYTWVIYNTSDTLLVGVLTNAEINVMMPRDEMGVISYTLSCQYQPVCTDPPSDWYDWLARYNIPWIEVWFW